MPDKNEPFIEMPFFCYKETPNNNNLLCSVFNYVNTQQLFCVFVIRNFVIKLPVVYPVLINARSCEKVLNEVTDTVEF
jgi:hypothetical protein